MLKEVFIVTVSLLEPVYIKVFDSLEKAEEYAKQAPDEIKEEFGVELADEVSTSIDCYTVH